MRQRVRHVGLAGSDLLEPRLGALGGALVVLSHRAGDRPPEQVGRRGDEALGGELVGDVAQVLVDAVDGAGQHDGGRFPGPAGRAR